MTLTSPRPALPLPPLEAMVLHPDDVAGFRCIYADYENATNEALAARAADPGRRLRRLNDWGRIDGYAVRYVPESCQTGFSAPIVVDSSVARFERGAGALQALMDDTSFEDMPDATRLFPRNIADNTECLHLIFEEDGAQFALYRVDFRVQNVVGSVGVGWRWPHGGPIQALKLAERQVSRTRTAIRLPASTAVRSVEWKEGQLRAVREA
jgi:hypothetical protein